jgi:DNA-binding transcriptional ArsR family regulator
LTNRLVYELDRDLNDLDLNDGADEAMRALVEPRRRAILRLVAHRELAAGEIAAAFDVNRTTVSQHLTVLKGAGLLSERREGTRRIYRARLEGLTGLRAYLDDIWSNALDIARGIAEAEHARNETRH